MYVLRMGLRRCIRIEQIKSHYYACLNIHQNDQTTNKNAEEYNNRSTVTIAYMRPKCLTFVQCLYRIAITSAQVLNGTVLKRSAPDDSIILGFLLCSTELENMRV